MHFLTLKDMNSEQLINLVNLGLDISNNDISSAKDMTGKIIGLYFSGPSTRTRTSFAAAALKLNASIIQYGSIDLQLSTGESSEDTGKVLSQYLDALIVRTNGSDTEMKGLAAQNNMSVINAMSESEHPTQIIGDLIAIKERLGSLEGIKILYMGEGNNTAVALTNAVSLIKGMELVLLTPRSYALDTEIIREAAARAKYIGSSVVESHNINDMPSNVDIVYTTRWETMGVSHDDPNWRESFEPFKVTEELFDQLNKDGMTFFMHDLPAVRGQEVDSSVLDGEHSIAYRQARHKMSAAMAILSTFVE